MNEDFLDPYHGIKKFSINFEPRALFVHVVVYCDSPLGIRSYDFVNYDKAKLEEWLQNVKYIKVFNFAHMVIDGGKEVVVKSAKRNVLFCLKASQIKLYHEGII